MLTLKKLQDTDIFVFDLQGDITQEGVDQFYALLAEKAAQHEKLRVLGAIHDFPSFESFKALGATAKMKTKALAGIGKYALLSDKGWMETLLPVGNFLTPGLPVKHFRPEELTQAIAWLEADADEQPAVTSATRIEHQPGTNLYSFVVDGVIREADITALYNVLRNTPDLGKVRLLLVVQEFDGFDSLRTLWEGMKADLASIGTVDKYALLAEQRWLTALVGATNYLTPTMDLKTFDLNEKAQALAWLNA